MGRGKSQLGGSVNRALFRTARRGAAVVRTVQKRATPQPHGGRKTGRTKGVPTT